MTKRKMSSYEKSHFLRALVRFSAAGAALLLAWVVYDTYDMNPMVGVYMLASFTFIVAMNTGIEELKLYLRRRRLIKTVREARHSIYGDRERLP